MLLALIIGMVAAAVVGYLVGLIALRRTGIYFAMITVAIAEVFFFVEFNPLSDWTGGENGLPGVPTPSFNLGFTTLHFTTGWSLYQFLAFCYFIGIVIALRIVRSPVGAVLSAIRDNPLRAAAVGHNIHGYKLTAFVIAAAYAGFAGGLLGVLQAFMPPDAFTFDTSGQLVMQTAIGGSGTLFGPLVGAAVWLFLQDFLQAALGLGAAWKLVLGVVFVLLVCFLRRGIIGGIDDLYGLSPASASRGSRRRAADRRPLTSRDRRQPTLPARRRCRPRHRAATGYSGPDPASHRPDQALWRPGRQQRHRFHRQSRRAARHHRPERRRQDRPSSPQADGGGGARMTPASPARSPRRIHARSHAPRAPRRVSGPVQRRPCRRPRGPAGLPRRGTTGFFTRVRALPDHRVIDRLLRSRLWIWALGIALLGVVTMQVSLLKLNSGISRAVETTTTLERQNAALEESITKLTATDRIQIGAEALGMLMPAGRRRRLPAGRPERRRPRRLPHGAAVGGGRRAAGQQRDRARLDDRADGRAATPSATTPTATTPTTQTTTPVAPVATPAPTTAPVTTTAPRRRSRRRPPRRRPPRRPAAWSAAQG